MEVTANHGAKRTWRDDLDPESIFVLDEHLGILAFWSHRQGKWQPSLGWHALDFPLTETLIDQLYHWKNATKKELEQKGTTNERPLHSTT